MKIMSLFTASSSAGDCVRCVSSMNIPMTGLRGRLCLINTGPEVMRFGVRQLYHNIIVATYVLAKEVIGRTRGIFFQSGSK